MRTPSPDLRTHAPSLLELSLQAAIRSPNLAQAPFLLSQGPNSHLGRLLQRAWHLKQASAWAPSDGEPTTAHSRRKRSKANGDGDGGQNCAICGRAFVVPRTEWLEWWRISAPVQKLGEHIGSSFGQTGHRATIYALREDGESNGVGVHTPDDVEVVPFIRKGCSWACCPKLQGKEVRGWVSGAAEATG